MLNFPDYRTLGAARNIAQEGHEKWVWSLRVMSTHSIGRHYTIPIFYALLGQHSLLHLVFDNRETSAFIYLRVFL